MAGVRSAVGAVVAFAALSGCAYLDVKQREWIFRVERIEPNYPSAYGSAEELWLPVVRDGKPTDDKLHGWWLPAKEAGAPTLLYLHGARWDLTRNAFRIERLNRMGFNVVAIDYRGFGRSSGTLPSEQLAYEDAALAWDYLKTREPDPAKRFVYGHSLGGAVAIDLVARGNAPAGLIVESTFTSIRDMADLTAARWLPLSIVLTQRFDSLSKMGDIRVPTLFVHGKADRFVPYGMTERLFEAASGPKKLLLVDDGGHSNVTLVAFDRYRVAVSELMSLAGSSAHASAQGASVSVD